MFYEILRPLAFLSIKHEGMWHFLLGISAFITGLFVIFYSILPVTPEVFGGNGVNRQVLGVFSTLPGFFIAALAAVATFNRQEMDEVMPHPAPLIKLRSNGKMTETHLTFRMFISYIFSYLTVISFAIIFSTMAADMMAPSVKSVVVTFEGVREFTGYIKFLYFLIMAMSVSHVISVTLFGLYFLSERIHRPFS